jgi:hypothetical protein
MNTPFDFAFFTAQRDKAFTLTDVEGVALQLIEVRQLSGFTPAHEAYALLFRGPLQAELGQGTYALALEGQTIDIFLVPVARKADGMHYEAIFN